MSGSKEFLRSIPVNSPPSPKTPSDSETAPALNDNMEIAEEQKDKRTSLGIIFHCHALVSSF